uniref:Uncharacterized protein n=3 Tax=Aegilops tauschii subsp. strangulata TaxID=200361 RepID=A0A453SXS8_AEGTS
VSQQVGQPLLDLPPAAATSGSQHVDQAYSVSPQPPPAGDPVSSSKEGQQVPEVNGKYIIEMNLPKHVEESNLCFMFSKDPQHVLKQGKRGRVEFPSRKDADEARARWAITEKFSQRDPKDRTKNFATYPYGRMHPIEGSIGPKPERVNTRVNKLNKPKPEHDPLKFRAMVTDIYDWCRIDKYAKECNDNELVRPFNFNAAAVRGSTSPDITLCEEGPIGNHVFFNILLHVFAAHLTGRTWQGKFSKKHLRISRNQLMCAILMRTVPLTREEEILDDILRIISLLKPVYTINDCLPPHYAEMLSILKKPPRRSNPNIFNGKELVKFQERVLKRPAFSTPEGRTHVVQEFYTNSLEFVDSQWTAFDNSAPVHLEDWKHIPKVDKRLLKVLRESHGMEGKNAGKFGKQSLYMRHSMVHLPDDRERNYGELLAAQKVLASARGDVSPHPGALAAAAIPGSSSPAAPPGPRPQPSSRAEKDVSLHSGALAAAAAGAIPCSASSPAAPPYYRPQPTSKDTIWGGILDQALDDKTPSSSSPGPDVPKVSFTLRERDMMGCYYFRDFMETFVDMMYEQKDKQLWLGEIVKSYERSLPKHGYIPHESIPERYMLEEGDEDEEES